MGLFSTLSETFGVPTPSQGPKVPQTDLQATTAQGQVDLELDDIYLPNANSWYTSKPYGFKMTMRGDNSQFIMFLPISPSNISINTSFATNVVPTLYGTVEEHSDVRYYDIVIEGTTGIAPKFVDVANSGVADIAYGDILQPGRAKFSIQSNVALGGFFSNTIGQVSNILNQANKAVSAIAGAKPIETAVYNNQTGYAAFHNLYRFLLKYKKNAAGVEDSTPPTAHPLTFFNYKDGNEYDVAVRSFVLRRSADNPMLYFYSITMRAYNIRPCGGLKTAEDLNKRLQDLGLNGVKTSTLLSSIKSVSSSAKAIVGSAVNGVNLFGR